MNYFAVNLKTLRNEKKLSQSQLAKELGVSNGMIFFVVKLQFQLKVNRQWKH